MAQYWLTYQTIPDLSYILNFVEVISKNKNYNKLVLTYKVGPNQQKYICWLRQSRPGSPFTGEKPSFWSLLTKLCTLEEMASWTGQHVIYTNYTQVIHKSYTTCQLYTPENMASWSEQLVAAKKYFCFVQCNGRHCTHQQFLPRKPSLSLKVP